MVSSLVALEECASDKIHQNVQIMLILKKSQLDLQKIASTGLMAAITVLLLLMVLLDAQKWLASDKKSQSVTSIKKKKELSHLLIAFPGSMAAILVKYWMMVILDAVECSARKTKLQNA